MRDARAQQNRSSGIGNRHVGGPSPAKSPSRPIVGVCKRKLIGCSDRRNERLFDGAWIESIEIESLGALIGIEPGCRRHGHRTRDDDPAWYAGTPGSNILSLDVRQRSRLFKSAVDDQVRTTRSAR